MVFDSHFVWFRCSCVSLSRRFYCELDKTQVREEYELLMKQNRNSTISALDIYITHRCQVYYTRNRSGSLHGWLPQWHVLFLSRRPSSHPDSGGVLSCGVHSMYTCVRFFSLFCFGRSRSFGEGPDVFTTNEPDVSGKQTSSRKWPKYRTVSLAVSCLCLACA